MEIEDEGIERIIPLRATSTLSDCGKPFAQIYKDYNHKSHKMDLRLRSLALVQINNLTSGRSLLAGSINRQALRASFSETGRRLHHTLQDVTPKNPCQLSLKTDLGS